MFEPPFAISQLTSKPVHSLQDPVEGEESPPKQLKKIKPLQGVRLVVLDRSTGVFALSLKPTPYACVAASKMAILSGGSTSQKATPQETTESKGTDANVE